MRPPSRAADFQAKGYDAVSPLARTRCLKQDTRRNTLPIVVVVRLPESDRDGRASRVYLRSSLVDAHRRRSSDRSGPACYQLDRIQILSHQMGPPNPSHVVVGKTAIALLAGSTLPPSATIAAPLGCRQPKAGGLEGSGYGGAPPLRDRASRRQPTANTGNQRVTWRLACQPMNARNSPSASTLPAAGPRSLRN